MLPCCCLCVCTVYISAKWNFITSVTFIIARARAHVSYLFYNGQSQITYNAKCMVWIVYLFFMLQFDLLGNFPMTHINDRCHGEAQNFRMAQNSIFFSFCFCCWSFQHSGFHVAQFWSANWWQINVNIHRHIKWPKSLWISAKNTHLWKVHTMAVIKMRQNF